MDKENSAGGSAREGKPESLTRAQKIWRAIFLLLIFVGVFILWGYLLLLVSFGASRPFFYMSLLHVFCLAVLLYCAGRLFRWSRLAKICKIVLLLMPVVWLAGFGAFWLFNDRYPQLSNVIPIRDYTPFDKGNKLVKVVAAPEFRMDEKEKMPRLDGAYALYPVYAAAVQALYPNNNDLWQNLVHLDWRFRRFARTNGSDMTFTSLWKDGCDLIFSAAPSAKQQAEAEKLGLKHTMVPFAREAFVFYVHKDNPVGNLTQAQIRDIYSGKITNWSQISPAASGKIRAFQRNEGSGSQTMLQKIMNGTPIMPAPRENIPEGMGGIINAVADYRNFPGALGFSFRYFTADMFYNGEIKMVAVDGVAPTLENIRNGKYPFIGDCYMISVRPYSPNTERLVKFMLSPAGQELVEKTGYVPLLNDGK